MSKRKTKTIKYKKSNNMLQSAKFNAMPTHGTRCGRAANAAKRTTPTYVGYTKHLPGTNTQIAIGDPLRKTEETKHKLTKLGEK